MVAAAIAGAGALSAGASLLGSNKAASSANQAAQLQHQQFLETQATLNPFVQAGTSVLPDLTSLAQSGPYGPGGTNYLAMAGGEMPTVPQPMTQDQLEKTPGYQFTLNQGLKSVQSSAAARGLGVSGAALKGAATYATGLASSNYQQQFANQQQLFQNQQQRFTNAINLNATQQGNLQNQFGRLQNTASLGESAGAQTGALGTSAAASGGNFLLQGGAASAAGLAGVGSSATGAAGNIIGNNLTNALLAGRIGADGSTGGISPFQGNQGNFNVPPGG